MNYETDIKPLRDTGQTAAQIAVTLAADTRLVSDIDTKSVRVLLRERLLWMQDTLTGARNLGSIGEAISTVGFPPLLKDALDRFASAVYDNSADTLSTNGSDLVASDVHNTMAGLEAVGAITAADHVAFDLLGGAHVFAAVDEAAVQAMFDAEDDRVRQEGIQVLQASIENTWINPMKADGVSTAADVSAAIKVGL